MTAIKAHTFSDIYKAVLRRLKIPITDTDALDSCKESINTRYETAIFRKKWPWRTTYRDLRILKKKTDGTLSVTEGSRSVTGTSTGFTSDHKGWNIEIDNRDEIYEIIAVDAATQIITLSSEYNGTTNSTATYTSYKNKYGLWPDLEEIDFITSSQSARPIDLVSPRELYEFIVGNPGLEGYPLAATMYSLKDYQGPTPNNFMLNYDFLSDGLDNDYMLEVYPHIPDKNYTIRIHYCRKGSPLDADTDEPLIPREKRHLLVYGALADMCVRERLDETAALYETKFVDLLAEMEADREYTDARPRLVVNRSKYRQGFRSLDPSDGDLGDWFGRIRGDW